MSEAAAFPSDQTAKRRWWLAVLHLLFAASGYLYVGRPLRYFASLAFYLVIIGLLFALPGAWLSRPAVFLSFLGLALAVFLGMGVDLIRLSLKQPDYRLRWYNRWWTYLGTFMIAAGLTFLPDLLGGPAAQSVRTFSIPSLSGLPALQVGDIIVVNNRAYREQKPARGDVVVFTLPRDEKITWIKRVIGLPGDRIQMKDGILIINGAPVRREPAGRFARPGTPPLDQFREHLPGGPSYLTLDSGPSAGDNTAISTVPPNHYFMLGDNRDNSADSRFAHIGAVPASHVLSRATGIILATRPSRIGTPIK